MATLWERAAHAVNRMFSLLCLFVALVVSHFGKIRGNITILHLKIVIFTTIKICSKLHRSVNVNAECGMQCAWVLFGLKLYVPANNFSVMSGRYLCVIPVLSNEDEVSCSRTQHSAPG